MFKRLVSILAAICLSALPSNAALFSGGTSSSPPATCTSVFPGSYYAGFSGLGLNCATQVLIMPWFVVDPTVNTGYANSGTYNTLAKGLVPQGYNSILGLGGAGSPTYWPEHVGSDNGEAASLKTAGMNLIGGVLVDTTSGTTVNSAQSMRTTMTGQSALPQLWGYNVGDEPACTNTPVAQGPDISTSVVPVLKTNGADTTRAIFWNFPYQYTVGVTPCQATYDTVLAQLTFSSFDWYPNIFTYPIVYILGADHVHLSSGTIANDGNDFLWAQGMATQYMHDKVPTHPVIPFVDGMTDAINVAFSINSAQATITSGSPNITIGGLGGAYPAKWTTQTTEGLGINDTASSNCIPASATIHVLTATTGTLRNAGNTANVNASCTPGALADVITLTGGPGGGSCGLNALNLCPPMLNEQRLTASQFYSEVWLGYFSGGYGHEVFQQDSTSALCGFGDPAGGTPCSTAEAGVSYTNNLVLTFAAILNNPRDQCTMQSTASPYHTTSTCTTPNGSVLTTGTAAVPGIMFTVSPLVGQTCAPGGTTATGGLCLFAISDRVSTGGATFTYNLGATYAGLTATICYDKRTHFDPTNAKTIGATHTLSGSGIFSDTIGDGGVLDLDDYDVLEYAIGRPC